MRSGRVLVAVLAASVAACAHYPLNRPDADLDPERGYRFDNLAPKEGGDGLFVCLTFSGGGTRAAAFTYGVLRELARTTIVIDGREVRLLDEVDCISSVSGGSFTAAYYALHRDRIFADFESRFLTRDIQRSLIGRALNPINWARLASPYFSRIDLAAELYDRDIFDGGTFDALLAHGRPFLIVNATNLETGRRFEFTPTFFDTMGSDLEAYPLARAVAASSAFPLLLSPVSLENHPVADGYAPPSWFEGALDSLNAARRRHEAALDLTYYLDKKHRHVHLMDGGLADNIGARARRVRARLHSPAHQRRRHRSTGSDRGERANPAAAAAERSRGSPRPRDGGIEDGDHQHGQLQLRERRPDGRGPAEAGAGAARPRRLPGDSLETLPEGGGAAIVRKADRSIRRRAELQRRSESRRRGSGLLS